MCIREKCFLKSFSSFRGEEKSRSQKKKKSLKIMRETILSGVDKMSRNQCLHPTSDTIR